MPLPASASFPIPINAIPSIFVAMRRRDSLEMHPSVAAPLPLPRAQYNHHVSRAI